MQKLPLVSILLGAATARADTPPPAPPPATTTATAEVAAPWTIGVEPRVGLIVPTSKLGANAIGGLEVDFALPAADHRLVLALGGTLSQPGHDGSVMDARVPAPTTYTIKQTELAIALDLDFRFVPAGHSTVPWIGVGPLLHMLRTTESTSIAPGDNTAQETAFGVELAGGVDFKAGPGFLGGDARLDYSKLDNYLTGSTNAGKLTISVGYRLVF